MNDRSSAREHGFPRFAGGKLRRKQLRGVLVPSRKPSSALLGRTSMSISSTVTMQGRACAAAFAQVTTTSLSSSASTTGISGPLTVANAIKIEVLPAA
jgi:hypothetical protein